MATIYCAGGEDTFFTLVSGFQTTWNAMSLAPRGHRANFARCCLAYDGLRTAATFPPPFHLLTPVFPAVSSFWAHARFGQVNQTTSTTYTNQPVMWLYDAAGEARLLIRGDTNGRLKISTRDAAGAFVDLAFSANNAVPLGELNYRTVALDWFVDYRAGGRSQFFINDVLVIDTGTMNITTGGAAALARVGFQALTNASSTYMCWSEVIVQDTDSRGASLWTLTPDIPGATQTWIPNTAANINEAEIADTTVIVAPASNALSGWQTTRVIPDGHWTAEAVVQEARISRGLTGPQNFQWYLRTVGGADHVSGAFAPNTALTNYRTVWPLNPATGLAWVQTDFVAGFNFGIGSLP